MSWRNKDLEVKSLFFFHLGTFRRRFGLLPALDIHFVPIKKSSLTRPRPREGAFSCVMAFGTMKRTGHTSTVRHRVVTVAVRKRAAVEESVLRRRARQAAHAVERELIGARGVRHLG